MSHACASLGLVQSVAKLGKEAQNRLERSLKIQSTTGRRGTISGEAPARNRGALEFRLLGPFEVRRHGTPLPLGGQRQRALIASLCLRPGAVLSVDELVDQLWGESPPPTVRHMVEVYVSKLRKLLGPGVLLTRAPGYLLDIDPELVDAVRFERLVENGREALERRNADRAATRLREALELWRGPALVDFAYESFAQAEIARLDDLRHLAEEDWVEAELLLGRADDLVGKIEAFVVAEPLRERRHGQLMLALYRSGRQADALAAYKRARDMLVGELGIEPGPELRAVHAAILNQDQALLELGRPEELITASARRTPRSRAALFAMALLTSLATAFAVSIFALRDSKADPPVRSQSETVKVVPDSVAVLDPDTATVVGDVAVGRTPGPIVFGDGAAWVANFEDKTVSRIDRNTHDVVTLGIGVRPYGLALGEGALWITSGGTGAVPGTVTRHDLVSERIETISLGLGKPFAGDIDPRGAPSLVGRAMPVVVSDGSVWVGRRYFSQVVRVDAARRKVVRRVRGPDPSGLAVANGDIWAVNFFTDTVWRINGNTGRVSAKIPVGEAPCCVAATDRAIWVVSRRTEVWRISPRSNTVEATIHVGGIPVAVAAGEGAVWVANYGGSSVSRIDAETHQVATVQLPYRPVDIAVGGGSVWVSVN
jgi:DNA-binding SARP family transcriptional activator/DNA-binding beta-propeller fold protein YncE